LTERQTIAIGGQIFNRFIRYPNPIEDGTLRCIQCGQLDEGGFHDMDLCIASYAAGRIWNSDRYLVDYLLGWAGLGPQQPWGAATSFAMEVAAGAGLILRENDTTLTDKGRRVAEVLADAMAERADLEQVA
jgi:hypothetical protein